MPGPFATSLLRRALVALIALKLAGLILVFDPAGLDAFDHPKSLFSRGLEWLTLGVLALALLRFGAGIVPRTRLHLAVLGLVVAGVLSAVFAEDRYVALFGEQERYLGLTFLLDMLSLYVAAAVALRTPRDWAIVGAAVGVSGLAAIAYAALQRSGLDPVVWQNDPRGRPFATFGNPDQFGHFLSVAFGIALGLAVSAPGRWRAVAATATAAALLAVQGVVATRGALLGLLAMLGVLLWLALASRDRDSRRRAALALSATAGLLLAVLAVTPLGARVLDTLGGGGTAERVAFYETALRAAADRPLLGYGLDGFGVAYPRFRDAGSVAVLGAGPQTSAHSWPLDAAVGGGLLGLAALLMLIGAASRALVARALPRNAVIGLAVLLGWVGYWAHGLVSVGSVAVGWAPWLALGAIAASPDEPPQAPSERRPLSLVAAALVLSIAVTGALSGIRSFAANRQVWDAELARAADAPEYAAAAMETALRLDPGRADHWNRFGLALDRLGLWRESGDAYLEAARRAPHRATYWANAARSRARVALATADPDAREAAFAAAESAVAADPNNPEAHAVRAEIALAFGRCDLALASSVRAIVLQRGGGAERVVAPAARCATDERSARATLEGAIATRDLAVLRVALAETALRLGDLDSARGHVRRALELDPGDAEARRLLTQLGP